MRSSRLALAVVLACCVWGAAHLWSATDERTIMETMVDPSAILIWRSVSTIVTTDEVVETFPRSDEEWNTLRKAAVRLAEGGRLLKRTRPRVANRDWLKWSQAIVDAADATIKAVEDRSPERVFDAGQRIYETCVGCHGGYSMMR